MLSALVNTVHYLFSTRTMSRSEEDPEMQEPFESFYSARESKKTEQSGNRDQDRG